MPAKLFSPSKRTALAAALALIVATAVPAAAAQSSAEPLPAVRQALGDATLVGQGQLRFLGLRIYDARLWAGPRFEALDFGAHAFALELAYHRAFTGGAIAQRSIEEIVRQGEVAPAQVQRWQAALSELMPDVQPGDRLTGVHRPGQGLQLWRGNQALGAIDDAELARRFFGIWLSPRTSEPGLRSALLARRAGAGP